MPDRQQTRRLDGNPVVSVTDQIIERLREHLRRIDAQDWDYFAGLRHSTEGSQAVSDLERLVRISVKP